MKDKKLKEAWRGWTQEEREALAKSCGTTQNYLRMIFTNGKKAGALMAVRIERSTAGKVTAVQLRPDVFGHDAGL